MSSFLSHNKLLECIFKLNVNLSCIFIFLQTLECIIGFYVITLGACLHVRVYALLLFYL